MLFVRYKVLSGLFLIFSAVYLLNVVLTPPDKITLEKYNISSGQLIALLLTITIPYVIIWFIALGGYLRFKHYTDHIKASRDGTAFDIISRGILLLTLWLPFSALVGAFTGYYTNHHPSATAAMVRLDNYANLLLLLPAFLLINRGAAKLLTLIRKPIHQLPQTWMMVYIVFSAVYVFLALHDPARQVPTRDVLEATYYLPDWATLTTLVIPRLIMWFLGIQAVYYLYSYATKVKGSLYKLALVNLARGIGVVVGATIILRGFQSLSTQLNHLNLGALLLIIYILLLIICVGYYLIAKGAKRLRQIEEI